METSEFDTFEFGDFGSDYAEPEPPAPSAPTGQGLPAGTAIAVVDADAAVRDYLAGQLGEGTGTAESLHELEARFGGIPVVAVLGPSCVDAMTMQTVAGWRQSHPEVGAILVTSEVTTELLQTALRSGFMDVLGAPIEQATLVEAVGRVGSGLRAPTPAPGGGGAPELLEEGDPGRVVAIFSTKGGSGKSVVATNMGVALARRSARPVALIDGHLQFGDVAVMLKMAAERTVADAINQIDRLDASLARDLLTEHGPSGLLVLPAPLEPAFAEQVTGEQMTALLDALRSFCGTVIIDLPAMFDEKTLSVLEAADEVVLVAGLDIPNIKNVKVGLNTLDLVGIDRTRIHLALNRADSKVKLDVGEVERTLGIEAEARIPSDVVIPISVNKGSPVVLSAPKSGVARALDEFAMRFLDEEVGESAESASGGRRRFFG